MRERLRKFITMQFGNPSGLIGRFIGNRMAKGNVYDAQWTISLLNIQPHDRVLEKGEVSSLPYLDESFDVAFSLHSIYFWPEPVDCLKELRRVLKQGGLLAITIQPKDKWIPAVDRQIMTLYFGSDLVSMFSDAGYRNIHLQVPPQPDQNPLECILGVK